jgi:hypothetical protein
LPAVVSIFLALLLWRFLIIFGAAVFERSGLTPEAAHFEARSALVGAGYTTAQSELVVRNPVARRVASMLIVTGYFGPATILALLGVSFVVPTNEDLEPRAVVLALLLVGLYGVDRFGLVRAIGSRPARALAERMVGATVRETWIVVGDHAIAAILVPVDAPQAAPVLAMLREPDLTMLAIERAPPGPTVFPIESGPVEPSSGDRVLVLGPQRVLERLDERP